MTEETLGSILDNLLLLEDQIEEAFKQLEEEVSKLDSNPQKMSVDEPKDTECRDHE